MELIDCIYSQFRLIPILEDLRLIRMYRRPPFRDNKGKQPRQFVFLSTRTVLFGS